MDSRTFRADNMLTALELVKKEMGSEAIIVSARNVLSGPAWQVWKKPQIEIVAMKKDDKVDKVNQLEPKEKTETAGIIYKNPLLNTQKNEPSVSNASSRAEALLDVIRTMGISKLEKPEQKAGEVKENQKKSHELPEEVKKVHSFYLNCGIDEKLMEQIASNCGDTLSSQALKEESRVSDYFRIQLEASVRTKKVNDKRANVIFLVGTSGSGRTSSVAKLSVHFANEKEKRVGWICADTVRIGAISEARTYTETIGLPLKITYTPADLKQAIQEWENDFDLILVDTPAFNPFSEMTVVELGSFLTTVPARLTWMVVPTTTTERNMEICYATLSSFRPNGFICNRLDEADNFSGIFNLAWKTQTPLYYYSFGSSVMNNIAEAKSGLLVRAILEEKFRS